MLKNTLIIIVIISNGLFYKSYAQANDSISKLLVNDLKQVADFTVY